MIYISEFRKAFKIFCKILSDRGYYVYSDEKVTLISATRKEVAESIQAVIDTANMEVNQQSALDEAKRILNTK